MSGSCREALPNIQELSVDSPGFPVVVGITSQMSGSGWESLPLVREYWEPPPECLGGNPSCPGMVGGSSGCPGVVERPSRISGSGREALPNVQE